MLSKLSHLAKRLFWPVLIVVFAASLALVLWSGQTENMSFKDAACSFEDKLPGCLDVEPAWNGGLAFYDSILKATDDTLQSLKALLWEHWNLKFAGAGEPAVAQNSILPLRVLENRKSGCMGLSWLAMMVAESRQIPLSVIMLPGHVFLRMARILRLQSTWNPTAKAIAIPMPNIAKSTRPAPGRALNLSP